MSNFVRFAALVAIAIVVVWLVSFFIGFLLRIALLVALVAIAYYWFARATRVRKNRRWR